MKRFLIPAAVVLGTAAAAGQVVAQECGDVTIATMNWQSAELLANVDKVVLSAGYGCKAEIVVGDTVPTLTSMAEKGEPDLAPEGWVDLVPEVVNKGIEEGRLIVAGEALAEGGVEGWWIPKYVADANPDVKTIEDVLTHPELFPSPEDPSKGGIFNGPQGWGAAVVTGQFFKAYNAADAGFVLVDPGSAAGLDGSLAKAYERKEGWVGYYWAPTALLGKYDMVKLGHGVPYDEAEWKRCNTVGECPDPKPNDWPPGRVQTVLASGFAERAGPALDYLKARSWTNADVNAVLAWMTDNQATGEDGAAYFLKNFENVWTGWLPPEIAEKVKSSL